MWGLSRDVSCCPVDHEDMTNVSARRLACAMHVPVLMVDRSLRISFMNQAAEELTGCQADEVQGEALYSLVTGESSRPGRALSKAMEQCLAAGEACSATVLFRTSYGPLAVRLAIVPTVSGGGVNGAMLIGGRYRGSGDEPLAPSDGPSSLRPPDLLAVWEIRAMLSKELFKAIEVLEMDAAIAQITIPDDRTILVNLGIGRREAREILEARGPDGMRLCDILVHAEDIVTDTGFDRNHGSESMTSFAAYPLHAFPGTVGCVVFGMRGGGDGIWRHSRILRMLCDQIDTSLRNHALNLELKQRNIHLQGLNETSKALSTSLDLNELLQTIMATAMSLVGAENCFVFELDQSKEKLSIFSMITQWKFDPHIELDIGEGLVGTVAATGRGILSPRAELDPRNRLFDGMPNGPSSMIVVPLMINDRLMGVMSLEKSQGVPFDRSQYELIEMFSVQAAMAMNNASMFDDLRRTASSLQMFNVLLTHDVANFNSPIHGYLEMLMREPMLNDRLRRYVRSALLQSENISELITDVRQMIHMRSNGEGWRMGPVDMVPLIREAIHDISSNVVFEDIGITFHSSVDVAMVQGNSFLKELFYNLLSNACKYGNRKPIDVELKAYDENGEWWKASVKDHGWGIPDANKGNLFKRFDELDTSNAADGHGIGLSVVSELVQRFGGRVTVEDRVTGDHSKGSVFTVLIPRYLPSQAT